MERRLSAHGGPAVPRGYEQRERCYSDERENGDSRKTGTENGDTV